MHFLYSSLLFAQLGAVNTMHTNSHAHAFSVHLMMDMKIAHNTGGRFNIQGCCVPCKTNNNH